MGPADLEQVLKCLPPNKDKRLLSGFKEDATVYQINSSQALIQTVDFITPILNDPYAFGAVAAANALSDIYAMGGKPAFALNIVGFPIRSLPTSILEEILKGGADKVAEAGIFIAGGHSVEDNAPKYGMTVTGFVDPARLIRKSGAQVGDALILTKPIGTGIITTAIDRGLVQMDVEDEIYKIMSYLNKGASEAMLRVGVNACTDVTGFGLLGHLSEMLKASQVSAQIFTNQIPLISDARKLARAGSIPAGTHNNFRFIKEKVDWKGDSNEEDAMLLSDAQTAGGLLIAVSEEKAELLKSALLESGCFVATEIGRVTKQSDKLIEVFA